MEQAIIKAACAIGAASTLRTNMIIGCAITETTGIYSLLIAFLILFAL